MTEIKEAFVPDIGDYSNVPVIEVLVAVGDTVSKGQSLITLESDKATMEVPSSTAGIIKEIKVKVGDTLSQGHVVALIEVSEETAEVTTPMTVNTPTTRAHNTAHPEDEGSLIEVRVPDIGDYTNVPVIEVLVAVGDTVSKDQSLITLESDKATLEVPSSATGVIKQLKVNIGDTLSQGDIVVVLQSAESTPTHSNHKQTSIATQFQPCRGCHLRPSIPCRDTEHPTDHLRRQHRATVQGPLCQPRRTPACTPVRRGPEPHQRQREKWTHYPRRRTEIRQHHLRYWYG